jgi:hypothetical protein
MAPIGRYLPLLIASGALLVLAAVPTQGDYFGVPLLPTYKPTAADLDRVTATYKYDPTTKDWAAVVSACLAAGRKEKRLFNFFTRAAFHDALAVLGMPCNEYCEYGAGALAASRC